MVEMIKVVKPLVYFHTVPTTLLRWAIESGRKDVIKVLFSKTDLRDFNVLATARWSDSDTIKFIKELLENDHENN